MEVGLATLAAVVTAVVVLLAAGAAAQDYFPGFEVAAQADVVHVTSNILARPNDDACVFDAEILAAAARNALRWHGPSGRRLLSTA